MGTIIDATNWKELKKQLRTLERKAAFRMTRVNSFHNGIFHRILHEVQPHNLVFWDGEQLVYLDVPEEEEDKLTFFENGFRFANCTYELEGIVEE